MLKIIGWIGLTLGLALAVVLVVAMRKPDSFRVERSTRVHAASGSGDAFEAGLANIKRQAGARP